MFKTVVKEQLVVPAHIDYLADIRDFVSKVGHRYGFSKQVVNSFKLSIDEATTNIIKHAYRDWEGSITIRAIVKKNSLTFVLVDQGKYFDPRRVEAPDLRRYVTIGKRGGLGIFIMRRLLDAIDYRKTEEGNELRLTKRREVPRIRRIQVPSLSLSLKARYSAITCAIITVVVALAYLFYFLREDDRALQEVVALGVPVAQSLTTSVAAEYNKATRIFDAEVNAGKRIEEALQEHEIARLVREAFFVDSSGTISATGANSALYFTQFEYPARVRQVDENAFIYANTQGEEVIDLTYPVYVTAGDQRQEIGRTHIWINKARAEQTAKARRRENLRLASFVLILGYAGTFVLVYIVLNPFRKLGQWVRTLGHEEVEDEMDIDASTEVGEIAKAFSDITTKLRESQKNLAEQERLQKEMQVAQEIQKTLLPTEFPKVEGYSIASFYEAAKEVGGDYFDFVEVDRDALGIAVADVSGKGVPGSLVMTMIRTALRTESRGLHSGSEVLCRVNDFVINDMKKGMFVTLFYVILDSKRRKINYASAGHNPMILYRGATKKTYYLNPHGFPLGIALPEKDLFKRSIESDTIRLTPDDILILYTDGITEAMNPHREMFGDERFLNVIREHNHLPVDAFVERLKDELHSFTEGNVQNDDITLVAIKEEKSAESVELERAKQAYRLAQEGMSMREACEHVGISTYAYNKYRQAFEQQGVESIEIDVVAPIEAKHLSVEEKTKIYDIIRKHPEYGAKRISEELNTETYGFEAIAEFAIYEELVRSRLNTRQLREAFVRSRGTRKRMKPPGTPLLTLDGRVIIQKGAPLELPPLPSESRHEETRKLSETATRRVEVEQEPAVEEPVVQVPEARYRDADAEEGVVDFSEVELDRLLSEPIEEVLSKGETDAQPFEEVVQDAGDEEDDVTIEKADSGMAAKKKQAEAEEDEDLEEWLALLDVTDEGVTGRSFASESDKGGDVGQKEGGTDFDLSAEDLAEEWGRVVEEQGRDESAGARDSETDENKDLETTFDLDAYDSFWVGAEEEETSGEEDVFPELEGEEEEFSFSELLESVEAERKSDGNGRERKDARIPDTTGEPADESTRRKPAGDEEKLLKEKVLIKGLRHYRADRYDEAIREFRKVVETYPDFKEAHSILGNAYFRNKMFLEAAEEYERVKQIDATDPDAYENMGVIYANRGEFGKAIREWERILEIDPSRKDIQKNIERAQEILGRRK